MSICFNQGWSKDFCLFFFFSQSLDELDDDDAGEKDRREEEEELVQANTFQNEAMTADPTTGHLMVRRDWTWGRRRKLHTLNSDGILLFFIL